MFIGQYICPCDENNHLGIPADFNNLFAGRVVLTQGFDRNILVLPLEVFDNLSNLVTALNIANPLARSLKRMLIGNASYSEIDQLGTIQLPPSLKEFAGLTSDAVWVGQGKYFEVWSQALWQRQELDLENAEANSQRFSDMDIAGL